MTTIATPSAPVGFRLTRGRDRFPHGRLRPAHGAGLYAPMRALGDLAAQGVALYKGFSLVVAPGRQGAVLRNDFVVGA